MQKHTSKIPYTKLLYYKATLHFIVYPANQFICGSYITNLILWLYFL